MKYIAIVLIMLLRLDALQRLLPILIELIVRVFLLRLLLLLLLLLILLCILIPLLILVAHTLTTWPRLSLGCSSCHCQPIALCTSSALLEAVAAGREATRTWPQ